MKNIGTLVNLKVNQNVLSLKKGMKSVRMSIMWLMIDREYNAWILIHKTLSYYTCYDVIKRFSTAFTEWNTNKRNTVKKFTLYYLIFFYVHITMILCLVGKHKISFDWLKSFLYQKKFPPLFATWKLVAFWIYFIFNKSSFRSSLLCIYWCSIF